MGGWPGIIEPLKMHGFFFFEADGKEGGTRIFVPVVQAYLQAIQGLYEPEIRVCGGNETIFKGA